MKICFFNTSICINVVSFLTFSLTSLLIMSLYSYIYYPFSLIENFATLDNAKAVYKSQEIIIFMRDLNAKVDNEKDDEIVGKFRLGIRNEHGEK